MSSSAIRCHQRWRRASHKEADDPGPVSDRAGSPPAVTRRATSSASGRTTIPHRPQPANRQRLGRHPPARRCAAHNPHHATARRRCAPASSPPSATAIGNGPVSDRANDDARRLDRVEHAVVANPCRPKPLQAADESLARALGLQTDQGECLQHGTAYRLRQCL